MVETQSKQRGRPSRLSQEMIVRVARTILQTEGETVLSIRRIASELNSSPMSIYRHVDDKDHLIVLVLEDLAQEIVKPELPDDSKERVLVLWLALYDCLAAQPWAVDVLAKGDKLGPSVLWFVERIVRAFLDMGLSQDRAMQAYNVIWKLTVGTLMVDKGQREAIELAHDRMSMPRRVILENAENYPVLTQVAQGDPAWVQRPRDYYRDNISTLLEGIRTWTSH